MIGQPGLPPNGAMASHGYTSGGGSTEGSPVHRVGVPPESYMQQVICFVYLATYV